MDQDPWVARVVPELRGERVLLRRLQPTDIDDRQALGRNAEENRMYGGDLLADCPMTKEEAESWYSEGADDPDRTRWAIEFDGRCIGACQVKGSSSERRRYSVGISDPKLWGRGLGTETTELVLRHAFDVLGVERVELMVLADNSRAIRSYEKAGFRLREILVDNATVRGQAVDDWMMEVHRAAFQSHRR